MNQYCSVPKEFVWKMNGSLTTIQMFDDEIISLPQRQNLKSKHSPFAKNSLRPSFSQETKRFYVKKQSHIQKSDSQQLPLHAVTFLDSTSTITSSYIATNQFSSDPLSGSLSHTSPRARSWTEASASDLSLFPVRRDFRKMELHSQSHSLMDSDDDNQRKKMARSWSQNSLQSDNSNDSTQLYFSARQSSSSYPHSPLNTVDYISSDSLPQQSSPDSTVSLHHQNSIQINFDGIFNNECPSVSSSLASSKHRKLHAVCAAQRYCNISADDTSSDDLDYASIWRRDDEFLFSKDAPSCDHNHSEKNEDVDRDFAAYWTPMATARSDDCDDDFGGFDSVRTSREDPLSECNDDYGCDDDWCGDKDFINEDLWSDVGSMKSLDFEEDSPSQSRSFIDNDGVYLCEDTQNQQMHMEYKQEEWTNLVTTEHDIDDLCYISDTSPSAILEDNSCSSKNITDCVSSNGLVTSQQMKASIEQTSCAPTIDTCEHPLTSRNLSKSDVQRLARAALLGEAIDFSPSGSNHVLLYLSAQRHASSLSAAQSTDANCNHSKPPHSYKMTSSPFSSSVEKRVSVSTSSSLELSLSMPMLEINNQPNENQIVHPHGNDKKSILLNHCHGVNTNNCKNSNCHEWDSFSDGEDTDEDDSTIFAQLCTDTSITFH